MGEFKNEIFVMIMLSLYHIYSFINRGDPFEKFVEKKKPLIRRYFRKISQNS